MSRLSIQNVQCKIHCFHLQNLEFCPKADVITFIHSIHYRDLYSAPSRLLLRSAPDPCTAKKKSFEARVECARKNPGEQSLRQRKLIPHRGANHQECTGLGCGGTCTSKRTKSNLCSDEGSELRPLVPGWESKDLGGRPEQDPDTPPDHGTNTEYDPLLEAQPVEYIKHVGRYVSSSRNASYEARDSADTPLEAAQTHSRETNVECGAVIKPICDKSVDKSSSSSGSERARDDT